MNEQIVLVATPNDYSIRRRGWLLRDGIIRELEKVPFLLDVTATLSCKSYSRRLARKTQVFGPKRGINIRTRLGHTQDLCEAARKASYMLKLNEVLTEVIALGHDVGHFSFGHVGEKVASREMSKRAGHEVEVDHGTISSIILQVVEAGGHGLNLDRRVLHGITYHSISSPNQALLPRESWSGFSTKSLI